MKSRQIAEVVRGWSVDRQRRRKGRRRVAQDEDAGHGRKSKLRVARLTALLHEFELHLHNNEVERARDRLATITTTLALALIDAQKRAVNTG
jgi:hypothetical protein